MLPEYRKLPPLYLRYSGLFDFDGLYSAVIDWAKNYGFMWREVVYKHKVPAPTGAEQEWEWELTKEVTEYIKYSIYIIVHSWDVTEVEVEENGKKRALTSGRMTFVIHSRVYTDWQKKFRGGKFAQLLGKWYEKAYQKNLENYEDQLYYRAWNLHALMKKYFDMQSKKHPYQGYLAEN